MQQFRFESGTSSLLAVTWEGGDGVKIPPSKVACCISRNKQLYGEYLLTCAALKNHKIGALYVHSSVYPEKKDKASEKKY